VGASLLAETWPSRWRPWLAAILQSAVNCGVLLACLFRMADRPTFTTVSESRAWNALSHDLSRRDSSALIVLWIRRAVPEPEVWANAHDQRGRTGNRHCRSVSPGPPTHYASLSSRSARWGLTAHWALMFWHSAHLRALARDAGWSEERVDVLANHALYLLTIGAIVGNFLAGWLARYVGYRRAITTCFSVYFILMMVAYGFRKRRCPASFFGCRSWALRKGAFALFT